MDTHRRAQNLTCAPMCISQICLSVLLFLCVCAHAVCLSGRERSRERFGGFVYAFTSVCTPAVVNEFERSNASQKD